MKITYNPPGINNFHNSPPLNLIVSGETAAWDSEVYLISPAQATRLRRHFCGIKDCRCPGGGAQQLDAEGLTWGVPVAFCEVP